MLLGQLSLLGLIIFSFLFIMSLFKKDGKTISYFIITVIFSVVFFIIITPEFFDKKTEEAIEKTEKQKLTEEEPEESEDLEVLYSEDKTEYGDNTPIELPEGPIPDPIAYEGNGDDVIEIKKPEAGPIVLYVKGNQDSKGSQDGNRNHFTIHGYDDDGDVTELFINIHDPYEGQTLDLTGKTSLLEIKINGDWEAEVRSLRSMEKVDLPGNFLGKGDDVFLLDDYVKSARIEGNKDSGKHPPIISVLGYKPAVEENEYFHLPLLTTSDNNYQDTIEVDDYIHILSVKAEKPWSIDVE